MKTRELEKSLAAADPIDPEGLAGLDSKAMEAELLADIDGIPAGAVLAPRQERPHRRRLLLAVTAAALAAAALIVLVLAGNGADRPTPAYSARLVRFAESTPLLLLEGPGWRVQDAWEQREPKGIEGSMEFVTGKPVGYGAMTVRGNEESGQYVSGMPPPSVRQRKVELSWRRASLAEALAGARRRYHSHGQRWTRLPVLDTSAHVDTRDEVFVNQGGDGDREMTAYWSEGGYLLELRAAVPSLAGFEERLAWLTKVDAKTWLEAMPAKIVKAADHDAAVREMLKGIPLPSTFTPSQIPDEGLTTNRDQLGSQVTGTVACLWFRQWGAARRSGDHAAEAEAERAMATSKHWPILNRMAKSSGYPEMIWQLAAEMPSGYHEHLGHRWRLLPRAEGLGCARRGIPVLPWKQRRQG